MSAAPRSLAGLSHCRAVLVRVTAGLTVEDLDYRQFENSKSNGEILLHIAGFEYLTNAAVQSASGARADTALWSSLKSGFAREAGFAPPEKRTLEEYLDLLEVVRQRTTSVLTSGDSTCGARIDGRAIEQVTRMLSASDTDEDPEHYRRLSASVLASVTDDSVPDAEGLIDVPVMLALHETYHRGQLTLNKYIRSRLQRGDTRP